MLYRHVCLESLGYTLPSEIVTSAQIEARLAALYARLRLPEGRLELMTGIAARRFWPEGAWPSDMSAASARRALEGAEFDAERVGALVHASVCRDHLEPATACRVHHCLGLSEHAAIYDVSNACLGLLNGILQVANMIELGQIQAGLVVGTESGRQLVENTIQLLNADRGWTRQSVKPAFASLTIGSASCAVLLVHDAISRTGNRLRSAVVRARTEHHRLCRSGRDDAGDSMRPLMETDSEGLLLAGVDLGAATYGDFVGEWHDLADSAGASGSVQSARTPKSICHQVGGAHRKRMLDALGLDPSLDYSTYPWLGNTGSVALPITLAIGAERGFLSPGDRCSLLGIGSGINSVMLAVDWNGTLVRGDDPAEHRGAVPRRAASTARRRAIATTAAASASSFAESAGPSCDTIDGSSD
ncbi:MAG: 3-oxoacyl-ACP synthase III [Planctomycetes bacterium]|nr:3-oxoacyl-ACP synthase III [Planctomycetota bacterium]